MPLLKKIIWVIGVLRSPSQASNHPDDLFQSRYFLSQLLLSIRRDMANQFLLLRHGKPI